MPSLLGGVEKKVKSNVLLRRTLGMGIGNRYSNRKGERPDGPCALRDFVGKAGSTVKNCQAEKEFQGSRSDPTV